VRAEQRTGEKVEQFPETGLGQMRHIDGPAPLRQLRHQLPARRAQAPWPGNGVAVGEAVGARVGKADTRTPAS
jgi:hypothetical protein